MRGVLALVVLLVVASPALAKGGPGRVGDFTVRDDGSVAGQWVTFTYGPDAVQDYSVGGVEVFDAKVERVPMGGGIDKDTRGAETRIRTTFFRLAAEDVPSGHVVLEAKGPITFTFPDRAALATERDRVVVTVDGVRGVLFAPQGDLRVDGDTVTVTGTAAFLASGKGGAVAARVADAAADKRIGAFVNLAGGPGAARGAVTAFGNVTVASEVEEGLVRFTVDGGRADARVLVFAIDPALLGNATDDQLAYAFDNATLARASSIQDVLDADDDGLLPERWTVRDDSGLHLLVSVPHYSVHVVEVQSLLLKAAPAIVAGVLAGLALTFGGGFALFRPRRH